MIVRMRVAKPDIPDLVTLLAPAWPVQPTEAVLQPLDDLVGRGQHGA